MRTWIYFQNPFMNVAGSNFKKALALSNYTDAQLLAQQADPFYGPLYNTYDPLDKALTNAYNNWKSMGGTQKGATLSVSQLLQLLSPGKINAWEYAVMGVYAKGTPEFVAIFPHGHKPFQNGEINQRIQAVSQLATALAGIAPLASTLADVQNFYAQLTAARSGQLGSMGNTGNNSESLSAATQAAMSGLFSILGACIANFPDKPDQADFLFDMETIRHHDQLVFTGALNGGETHLVLKHTFAAADDITLTNSGATGLNFYLSSSGNDLPEKGGITVKAGDDDSITAADLGDVSNTYLYVVNNDALAEGQFKVAL